MSVLSLKYYTGDGVELSAVEQSLYGAGDVVRQMTRAAIRRYVSQHWELMTGKVLDYGCGRAGTCAIPQPYRSLIDAKQYFGWEPGDAAIPDHCEAYDAILCTQVLQNVEDPADLLCKFYGWLKPGGHVIITYPVAWEQIERELWRFTEWGMWHLAHRANFSTVHGGTLCKVKLDGALDLALVNGYVGKKGA